MTDLGRLWDMTAELHSMLAAAGERAMETRAESDREMARLLNRAHGAVNAAATFRALSYVPEGTQAEPE